jgi:hypothetical protein
MNLVDTLILKIYSKDVKVVESIGLPYVFYDMEVNSYGHISRITRSYPVEEDPNLEVGSVILT